MRGFLRRLELNNCTMTPRERPDFILNFKLDEFDASPIRISCELTEYCAHHSEVGSIDRRLFAMWTDFAMRLRERLRREGLSRYYGAIHFQNPDRNRLPACEEGLIEEIVSVLRQTSGSTTLVTCDSDCFPMLAQHVEKIFLQDTSPEDGILWWAAHLQTGEVDLSTEALELCVKNKDQKAESFEHLGVRESWLLVHAPGMSLSDTFVPIHDCIKVIKVAVENFDRVYLWDGFGENICQVYPRYVVVLRVRPETS